MPSNISVSLPDFHRRLDRYMRDVAAGSLGTISIYDRVIEKQARRASHTRGVTNSVIAALLPFATYDALDTTSAADKVHVGQTTFSRPDGFYRLTKLLRGLNTVGVPGVRNEVSAATGSVVCVATASLVDGENVAIDDGFVDTTYNFDTSGTYVGNPADVWVALSGKARGTITPVATASLVNAETFVLNDGTNPATTFEFDTDATLVPASASNVMVNLSGKARGQIVAVAKASLIDEETFVLNDGTNPAVTFAFDFADDGVLGGATAVLLSAAVTATDVADAMRTAINGVGAGLAITAFGTGTTVYLRNDAIGVAGNTTITDTVANAGFIPTNFTTGAATAYTTLANVGTAMVAAVNGVAGTLDISAQLVSGVVYFTNGTVGTAGNQDITETVGNAGFTKTNMAGGLAAAISTAPAVATALGTLITSNHPELTVSVNSATISLTHKVKGAFNTAISTTVANAGFSVTGLAGGVLLGGLVVLGVDHDGDVLYTATVPGPGAQGIRVRHVVSGANTPLSVSVAVGTRDVTVNVATNGGGAATSTAADIETAVNAHVEAQDIVVADAQGVGTSVTAAVAYTALSSGLDLSGVKGPKVYFIYRTVNNAPTDATPNAQPIAVLVSKQFLDLINV